uniref:Uncharacterized protein n=1 Tax=viral metagenome TaxID=1070528 RepID=A0A6C0IX64_9ZZZZ
MPLYEKNPKCPKCISVKVYSVINTPNSLLLCCMVCNFTFHQKIIGYKEYVVKK